MTTETDKIFDIVYYAKEVERYTNDIRDIDILIKDLENIVCEEDTYDKALQILIDNSRVQNLNEIISEQLKGIRDYQQISRTNAIIRLTHTLTDEEEESK